MFSLSALFMLIFFRFVGTPVFADEVNHATPQPNTETVSTLEFRVTVPEDFDKTILINFTSKEQQNIMARLDKQNGYVSSQEVEEGTYGVDFISIVGENASDYNISAPEQVVIKAAAATEFQLTITLKPTAQKAEIKTETKTEGVQPVPGSAVQSHKDTPHIDGSVVNNVTVPDANKSVEVLEETKGNKVVLNDSTISTIIGLSTLVLLSLLFFFYKQIRYKHDYYDC
jgi:hypothetical protein